MLVLLAASLLAEAQPRVKPARVGYLGNTALAPPNPFADGLREWRWIQGLLAYGPSLRDASRGAARYVDKILNGAKPADLPVEQPREFRLVVNLRPAKVLGLTVPPSVLVRADEIIE